MGDVYEVLPIDLIYDFIRSVMLIILSPAKTMDMSPVPAGLPVTEPEFRNDAELLAAKMRRYTQEEIAVLL